MWTRDKSLHTRGFSTPPPTWKSGPPNPPMVPMSERKRVSPSDGGDLFHVMHKVPVGDSPYVRAKQVQLIEKDPSKAISLFWAAINAGDRVDSALKDMAIVMKQLNRSEEAIEAIKSFRHLCPHDSQESLNNVLVELYKRAGRIEEEIEMLQSKLKHIDEGIAFGGRRTKTARSQGKKVQITVEQERSRILGNLAWAYLQQGNYKTAEEYYMKSLSLELDKNKQCNLAICLMHMNRLAEAKSLLQVVRASSGNKPMDESYAKSFERAIQMLTELEAKSVLRPIQLDENCCKEISRFPISPINRNSKQGNSLTNEGQHYVSGCMISRRWADGHEEETVSVNKWKKDCYFKNSCEGRSSFSSRMKENQGGIVGTETTPYSKTFFSPAPDIWNREVLFTQPRRSSRGFNDGHQTREIWGRGVGSSNKKLSFESCSRTENMRAHVVRSLNEDLLASTTGKSEVAFQNSVSSISSPISRDLRRRPQKDAAVRSVLQPISSGNWKCTSRANDGCFQLKDEAVVVSSSQNTVNGDWRRTSWENDGMKKSAEPLMVGEDAKALEISTDGGPNQSSDTTVLGSMEWRNAFVEDCFGENTSSKVDDVHQPIAENQKPAPDFSMYSKGKKSWADMVEEEEQELLNGRTEYFDSWNTEDGFNNENLNCNITPESPCLQSQMKSLGQKLQSTDLVDEYVSGNAASSRNSTVRRSLCFGQQQEQESVDYISSSPVPKEALNFEGSDSVQANGKGSIYGKNSSFSRRKRLQSFQDITEFQDSP